MSLLPTSAYLDVCKKCGSHAMIILSGGRDTITFFSKEEGRILIKDFLEREEVSKEEVLFLGDELERSTLPEALSPEQGRQIWDDIFSTLRAKKHAETIFQRKRSAHNN